MFIAMNRFKIIHGYEEDFENVWRSRDSRLKGVPGFLDFHLLKGHFDETSQVTIYASHTLWSSRDAFIEWTQSESFRDAHKNAGDNRHMYMGGPFLETFETVVDLVN